MPIIHHESNEIINMLFRMGTELKKLGRHCDVTPNKMMSDQLLGGIECPEAKKKAQLQPTN